MYKVSSLDYNITINRLIRTFELNFKLDLQQNYLFLRIYFYFAYETKIDKQPIDTILFSLKSRRDDETSFLYARDHSIITVIRFVQR